jgi:hypothetical protein
VTASFAVTAPFARMGLPPRLKRPPPFIAEFARNVQLPRSGEAANPYSPPPSTASFDSNTVDSNDGAPRDR